ncbi:MAG: hypothetical protein ABFD91_15695 [Anaerohalosphaeraceae bacterium]
MKKISILMFAVAFQAVLFAGPTLDLSADGASGSIDGAYFRQTAAQSTGTGSIHAFVRMEDDNDKDAIEQGYNTDHRPLNKGAQYDENYSPTFTRSLLLSLVPTMNINGILYREFLLDINESNSGTESELSLDNIKIYLAHSGDLFGKLPPSNPETGEVATLIYDLDKASDNWIKLDYSLNTGSGSGDMFAYIPDSLFKTENGSYVYFYSMFGENIAADSGFEEWAVRLNVPVPPVAVPAPGALMLAAMGMSLVGYLRRGRSL